jgi:RNA polymerase sigma factor (sigma-70 family)
MNAVISGRADLALLIEGESLMSLDVDDLETLVPRSPYDLRFLLADATDLVTLENTGREEIAQRLDLEHDIACALDMTLIALDPDSSMELRAEAVAALDELLADARVIERLEFTMYAKPLPDAADLMGAAFCAEWKIAAARSFCAELKIAPARSFFVRLSQYQTGISAVREAWDALPDNLFGDEPTAKAVFHDAVCNEGLFRLLALSYGDHANVSAFLLEAHKNKSLRSLRNYRDVLQQWCAPIRTAASTEAPVIESEYADDYEEPTETPPSTVSHNPRSRQVDVKTSRAEVIEPQRLLSKVEATLGKAVVALPDDIVVNTETALADLVRLIIAGEARAEEEMVRRYKMGVSMIIDRIVRSRSVTEDLSQNTFILALTKVRRGDVREPERLSVFICTLARNVAIDYIRGSKSLRNPEAIAEADANAEQIHNAIDAMRVASAGELPDPEGAPTLRMGEPPDPERTIMLLEALSHLSAVEQEIFRLFYWAEQSPEEIAQRLDLKVSNAIKIRQRANKKLGNLLDVEGKGGHDEHK